MQLILVGLILILILVEFFLVVRFVYDKTQKTLKPVVYVFIALVALQVIFLLQFYL